MIETHPHTFTLWGEIHIISAFFSLDKVIATPTVIAAGSAGGTQIVIKSRDFKIINLMLWYFNWKGIDISIPRTDKIAITPMNFNESEWNLNLEGLGYNIDFMRRPFVVSKEVQTTNAKQPLPKSFEWITSVPEKIVNL